MATPIEYYPKMNLLRRDRLDPRKCIRFFDDFTTMATDDTTNDPIGWDITQDAGATAQIGPADKRGGWFNISCDGDDNDECYAESNSQAFIFNTTDELMFECEIQITAGSTDGEFGAVVGLSDISAANTLVDDTGEMVASYDGAVFYHPTLGNFNFETSNATTQNTTTGAYTWTDADLVRLGFFYDPNDGTTAKVVPVVNGVSGTVLDLTISGLLEMGILLGIKTGEAAEQTLEVDWVEVIQRRSAATDINQL